MTVTAMLRSGAIATALVGLIDPSWTARRPAPVFVDLRAGTESAKAADDVRRRLTSSLGIDVTFDSEAEPVAVVLVGRAEDMTAMHRDDLPISTVSIAAAPGPNVRVVAAADPDPVRVGWAATFNAVVEARGLAGKTSRIVLEERGAEIAHLDHQWTRESERFDAALRYAPPVSGTSIVTLRAVPQEGESITADNAVDLRLVASGQRLKVLVHEPRPSWNATFVRRAIEQDPSFEVSTFAQASRGLEVRAGSPPPTLTSDSLSPFDVVLIGAPEELGASEIDAIRSFARRRGGAVVLLPDRRPSGRYLELIPSPQFDEVLVENAVELRSIAGAPLRASELAIHRGGVAESEVLASLEPGTSERGTGEQKKTRRAVVLEWPDGAGRVLFSGAMDAWRFRAAPDDGFGQFWRARIAEAALAAPARLQVSVTPGVPRPAEGMTIRAHIRQTEFEDAPGRTRMPAVRARLIGADGTEQVVRLWPTAEQGVLEGRLEAPPAGLYDLQVSTATGVAVDEVVTVLAEARHPSSLEDTERVLDLIAASTGGVSVSAADLAPLERYLRGLSSGEVERTIRPARSFALLFVFAALLALEWTIRRRHGRA